MACLQSIAYLVRRKKRRENSTSCSHCYERHVDAVQSDFIIGIVNTYNTKRKGWNRSLRTTKPFQCVCPERFTSSLSRLTRHARLQCMFSTTGTSTNFFVKRSTLRVQCCTLLYAAWKALRHTTSTARREGRGDRLRDGTGAKDTYEGCRMGGEGWDGDTYGMDTTTRKGNHHDGTGPAAFSNVSL